MEADPFGPFKASDASGLGVVHLCIKSLQEQPGAALFSIALFFHLGPPLDQYYKYQKHDIIRT